MTLRIAALALAALLASGCTSVSRPPSGAATAEPSVTEVRGNEVGRKAVDEAMAQLGVRYRYGGSTPDGFDCSGLVHYAYQRAGLTLPRESREQRRRSTPLTGTAALAPGDLLFFHRGRGGALQVALYVGDNRFVHAPSRGKGVRVESLGEPHWSRTFIEARRPDGST